MTEASESGDVIAISVDGRALTEVIKEVEAKYFSYVMTKERGNKTHAAERAGLSIQTFRRKISNYNIRTVFRFE